MACMMGRWKLGLFGDVDPALVVVPAAAGSLSLPAALPASCWPDSLAAAARAGGWGLSAVGGGFVPVAVATVVVVRRRATVWPRRLDGTALGKWEGYKLAQTARRSALCSKLGESSSGGRRGEEECAGRVVRWRARDSVRGLEGSTAKVVRFRFPRLTKGRPPWPRASARAGRVG